MSKVLYYYNDFIAPEREYVEQWIGATGSYTTEEGLMRLIENEIYIIEDIEDLRNWCLEFGFELNDLQKEFGIPSDYFMSKKEGR